MLHNLGQSIWLDNITRDMLESGTLERYIKEFSVTGLTSNPTIFHHAIKNSTAYDDAIRKNLMEGKSGEELIFELALDDLTRAAAMFRPIHDQTGGVDGWVSLEVSPLLVHDTVSTITQPKSLHARAGLTNLRQQPEQRVQSEISDFGFEVQDSSNFTIPFHKPLQGGNIHGRVVLRCKQQ